MRLVARRIKQSLTELTLATGARRLTRLCLIVTNVSSHGIAGRFDDGFLEHSRQ